MFLCSVLHLPKHVTQTGVKSEYCCELFQFQMYECSLDHHTNPSKAMIPPNTDLWCCRHAGHLISCQSNIITDKHVSLFCVSSVPDLMDEREEIANVFDRKLT